MDEKQLLELKKKIEKAQGEKSELQGSLKHLQKQLKEEWNCSTVEEAQTKLEDLYDQKQQIEKTIDTLSRELDDLLEEEDG